MFNNIPQDLKKHEISDIIPLITGIFMPTAPQKRDPRTREEVIRL